MIKKTITKNDRKGSTIHRRIRGQINGKNHPQLKNHSRTKDKKSSVRLRRSVEQISDEGHQRLENPSQKREKALEFYISQKWGLYITEKTRKSKPFGRVESGIFLIY